jgi:hypothetical protein
VTGITKSVKGGLYSAFNNPVDISLRPEYGALTGFTHEEIRHYFAQQVKQVADYQGMNEEKLLDEMKNYYNGFCFDGETFVYNPFSALNFFEMKQFDNFWFDSGSPKQLISFFQNNKHKLEDFRAIRVMRELVANPINDIIKYPELFLLQLGYLSLRHSPIKGTYLLDYPNKEVRDSMSMHLMMNYFKRPMDALKALILVKEAVMERDPTKFVEQINNIMIELPYDYFQTGKRDEYFYGPMFFLIFSATGLAFQAEKHGHFGRSDFIINYDDITWVVELKVSNARGDGSGIAKSALAQIKETRYGEAFLNPVLLGLAINDKERRITAWECEGGLAHRQETMARPKLRLKPVSAAKRTEPENEEDEENDEGPRMRPR